MWYTIISRSHGSLSLSFFCWSGVKVSVCERGRSIWPKILGKGGRPPPAILPVRKLFFVTICLTDRHTDGRTDTDRQTDCSSQLRGCVAAARHSTRRLNVTAFHACAWAAINKQRAERQCRAGATYNVAYSKLKWVSCLLPTATLSQCWEKPRLLEEKCQGFRVF